MKHLLRSVALAGACALLVPGMMYATPSLAAPSSEAPEWAFGHAQTSSTSDPTKLDVLGVWAHPDDDASFSAPCGVWGDLADVRCGIMLTTRGEGGSNSVGSEAGPDLGLRRENEDRAAHVRDGTVDVYFLDRVDFFYNTSAPLTHQLWNHDETLRRATQVVRETRPEILVTWPASFDAGHGNHQAASMLAWEVAQAAADPNRFPEQLSGPNAVQPWQVKKVTEYVFDFGNTTKLPDQANCLAGYAGIEGRPYTVAGTWTGYESEYTWVEGNVQGQSAGTPKTWAQVGGENAKAHATQARLMEKTVVDNRCTRFLVGRSWVPMQENGTEGGGDDRSILFGASLPDPSGMPLGTLMYGSPEAQMVAPGESVDVTVTLVAGEQAIPAGALSIDAPAGWTVSDKQATGELASGDSTDVTFTVTAPDSSALGTMRLPIRFASDSAEMTGYNETHVDVVAPVNGRFTRAGNAAYYDQWTAEYNVFVYGQSPARRAIGAGESITVPVTVTNRSSEAQSGTVELTVPEGYALNQPSQSFDAVAPGKTATVEFILTHTDPAAVGNTIDEVTATTTAGTSVSTEKLELNVVPTTVIPKLAKAPALNGDASAYGSTPISVATRWEGEECSSEADCGGTSQAWLGWYDDALYALVDVVDEQASAAATPDRCFGHWLVDSVEFLLDPLAPSNDTSTTFKLGVFPFTDDPDGRNGNGANGPCWSRDADHHQGFSTGPLAETIEGGLNAPGVEVKAFAPRDDSGAYTDGHYKLEVKLPLANLPAAIGPTSTAPTGDQASNAVNPTYLGFNITPYDSDTPDFVGQTRLAWSAFGSQQSEPYRWGHAYLDGYEPPTDRSHEAGDPIIPDSALDSIDSPQTVFQSATRGVPIAGLMPAADVTVAPSIDAEAIRVPLSGTQAGTARAFLWKGDPSFIPVWTSSCANSAHNFDACSPDDGAAMPWQPDMGGRLLASAQADVGSTDMTIELTDEIRAALGTDVHLLVSYRSGDTVNAWAYPIVAKNAGETPTPKPDTDKKPGDQDGQRGGDADQGDPNAAGRPGGVARTGASGSALIMLAAFGVAGAAGLAASRRRH